ncbi:hypothetical protein CGCSCA4_v005088 [Colletotrichum siamense]|uniref:Extracellular membrane protein CFEM domain-containing protein n=1 Tax=Colletotrichum siamense TaxID=690259 RepID=A0A9P5K7P4_COLSI|nr:hypothetical protein CGCSCA4_v005088 [Colletotrichum siamense]KAF4861226.1 hypothetical protein CGCSCA2_v004550 [Colletotrichum siamense]
MQFSNTIVTAFTLALATFSTGVNARCGPRNGLCSGELSFRCFDVSANTPVCCDTIDCIE